MSTLMNRTVWWSMRTKKKVTDRKKAIEQEYISFNPIINVPSSGWGWTSFTCQDVEDCITTDVGVQGAIETIINNFVLANTTVDVNFAIAWSTLTVTVNGVTDTADLSALAGWGSPTFTCQDVADCIWSSLNVQTALSNFIQTTDFTNITWDRTFNGWSITYTNIDQVYTAPSLVWCSAIPSFWVLIPYSPPSNLTQIVVNDSWNSYNINIANWSWISTHNVWSSVISVSTLLTWVTITLVSWAATLTSVCFYTWNYISNTWTITNSSFTTEYNTNITQENDWWTVVNNNITTTNINVTENYTSTPTLISCEAIPSLGGVFTYPPLTQYIEAILVYNNGVDAPITQTLTFTPWSGVQVFTFTTATTTDQVQVTSNATDYQVDIITGLVAFFAITSFCYWNGVSVNNYEHKIHNYDGDIFNEGDTVHNNQNVIINYDSNSNITNLGDTYLENLEVNNLDVTNITINWAAITTVKVWPFTRWTNTINATQILDASVITSSIIDGYVVTSWTANGIFWTFTTWAWTIDIVSSAAETIGLTFYLTVTY